MGRSHELRDLREGASVAVVGGVGIRPDGGWEVTAEEKPAQVVGYTVEGFGFKSGATSSEPQALAREAIALLRRVSEHGLDHHCPGPMTKPCTCGLSALLIDLDAFLDGEPP